MSQLKDFSFKYEQVFNDQSKNKDIFGHLEILIESVFERKDLCITVYGQSGTGKIFTLIGDEQRPMLV